MISSSSALSTTPMACLPFLGLHAVDVILADTCLKKTNTLDYLSDIKKNFPKVKVVIMTGFPEVSFLKKAKKEGADSFIYKNTSLEETKQVIVSTYRGYSIFPSEKISDEKPLPPRSFAQRDGSAPLRLRRLRPQRDRRSDVQ
jgi:DNA-binding NarL/FixJ family response regulator